MKCLVPLCLVFFFACKNGIKKAENNQDATSYWLSLKDSFAFQNLQNFNPTDSVLANAFFNGKADSPFKSPNQDLPESILLANGYLYSWQGHDSLTTSFTLLSEGMGECIEIHYCIIDKSNKLVTKELLARLGSEPGSYEYKTRSSFISKDTILQTHTRVYPIDEETLKPLKYPVGDTLTRKIIILSGGYTKSIIIDSSINTQHYKNKYGLVTQKGIDEYKRKQL